MKATKMQLILVALSLGTATIAYGQTPLYEEFFTSSVNTSVPSKAEDVAQFGWTGAASGGGWYGYYDSRTPGSLINTGTGLPVNAPGTAYNAGSAYMGSGASGPTQLGVWTDSTMGAGASGYAAFSAISLASPLTFSVLLQNESGWGTPPTSEAAYVLVQNGGNWYASAIAFTSPTSVDPGSANGYGNFDPASLTLSGAMANWVNVTLTPGTYGGGSDGGGTVVLGTAATSDLTGNITGVGVMLNLNLNSAGGSFNVADFSVSVPEPTTLVLAGLGGLALLAFRRRN